jgi:hypothetical protein
LDLSFRIPASRIDFAAIVAASVARAAASATASAQSRLRAGEALRTRFAPADGRFDAATARSLAQWKEG